MPLMCITHVAREAAVLVGLHLFGIKALDQAAPDEGTQVPGAGSGLHLSHDGGIQSACGVKNYALRHCWGSIDIVLHFLKHPINDAHREVHMRVQAGAEAVDERHCTGRCQLS